MIKYNLAKLTIFITLPIFLILTNIQVIVFDLDYFENKYEQYNIVQNTGIMKKDLMIITDELLKFLRGKRDNILIFAKINGEKSQVFEKRERLHLKDVKNLFLKGFFVRNSSVIVFIIAFILYCKHSIRNTVETLKNTTIIYLTIIVFAIFIIYTNFNKYFTIFHKIIFHNDLWLLDVKEDILIQMYPLVFFSDSTYKIIAFFIIELIVIFIVSQIFLKKYKNV